MSLGPSVDPARCELNDEAEFAGADLRFDRADDAFQFPDRGSVADLERCLAREVSGRDDFLAASKLVPIGDGWHRGARYRRGETAAPGVWVRELRRPRGLLVRFGVRGSCCSRGGGSGVRAEGV